MSIKKLLSAAPLIAASFISSVSSAQSPATHGERCILMEHQITAVRPYEIEEPVGRAGTVRRLRGAQLYVPAERGLSAEWLQMQLNRHLADMQRSDMRDCPLDVKGVRGNVESAGAGYWVQLIAADAKTAKEVLRRARLLGAD